MEAKEMERKLLGDACEERCVVVGDDASGVTTEVLNKAEHPQPRQSRALRDPKMLQTNINFHLSVSGQPIVEG